MTVYAVGSVEPHDQPIAKIYLLKKEEGGKNRPYLTTHNGQLYSRTFDIQCQVNFKDKDMALPGEDVEAHLRVSMHVNRFLKVSYHILSLFS